MFGHIFAYSVLSFSHLLSGSSSVSGLNRLNWAFWLAHAAIDALIRMNDQHVLAFVEAINGAHFNTVHVFALNAGIDDDIGHGGVSAPF